MEMLQLHYDAIVVANLSAESCYEQCIELGIDISKVILLYNNCKLTDINQNYEFMKDVLGEKYAKIVKERYHIVRGVESAVDRFERETGTLICKVPLCDANGTLVITK